MKSAIKRLSPQQCWMIAFSHRGCKFSQMDEVDWYCLRKGLHLPIKKPLVYVDFKEHRIPILDGYIDETTSAIKAWSATLNIYLKNKEPLRIMAAFLANMQKKDFKRLDMSAFLANEDNISESKGVFSA